MSVLVGTLALAACGCKSKEAQVQGRWKVKEVTLTGVAGAQAESMKGLLMSTTYQFKDDKKVSISMAKAAMEGDWALTSKGVEINIKTVLGLTLDQIKQKAKGAPEASMLAEVWYKPVLGILSGDGKTLTIAVPGGLGSFILEKDSSG
ncbi:hypothetical protein OP10G_2716 [Fimbriimonas ginsengisoli Gsoil 348]|uniref:Uncharacterized protein n=2 Tax=Fimbriimonas ginsengisoli TaxID=1005039 RepID=A0A068NWX1_FIMGI|nr:hypothetical protein OP10G_2716 [Fimbriimonas ginsengisoli Gsoil 348]